MSTIRIAMFLNALFAAFLAGGLALNGELLRSVITLGFCAASVGVWHLLGMVQKEM
jgi:hypothetical protein